MSDLNLGHGRFPSCCLSELLFWCPPPKRPITSKVLSGAGYTQKADLWSAGVIAFVLLSGTLPFLKDEADLNDQVRARGT